MLVAEQAVLIFKNHINCNSLQGYFSFRHVFFFNDVIYVDPRLLKARLSLLYQMKTRLLNGEFMTRILYRTVNLYFFYLLHVTIYIYLYLNGC